MHVTFEQAEKAVEAALRKSKEINTQMCIAVVDSGADLKAFVRMDDAWVGSVDIAIKKAKTACFFGMNTGQIGALSQPNGPLYGIEHSNDGLITFPGGVPIVDKDGVPGVVDIQKSSGHGVLDKAALKTVKKWKFSPAQSGSMRFSSRITIPIQFALIKE